MTKQSSLLFMALILPTLVFSQVSSPERITYKGEKYWKYFDQDTSYFDPFPTWHGSTYPKDGKWISYYEQDQSKIAQIFNVQDSLLEGELVIFDVQGNKRVEYEFHKGQAINYCRYWNKNGVLTYESQYQFDGEYDFFVGRTIGVEKSWFDDGQLSSISHYNDNGKRNGAQIFFYSNGNKEKEYFYHQGQLDSTYTLYHPNGQIKSQWTYHLDKFVDESPYKEYHSNGQISGTGPMTEGRKTGHWIYYHENGNKKSEGEYGIHVYKHSHGDRYFAIKIGHWKYWYPNGFLLVEGEYGEWKQLLWPESHEADTPLAIAKRKEPWTYYNPDGQVVRKQDIQVDIRDY